MKFLFVLIFLFVTSAAQAEPNCKVDLNADGICDSYSVSLPVDDLDFSNITISIGGTDEKRTGSFELGNGGLSNGYIPGDFSLLIDYQIHNTLITKYDFRWNLSVKDWVLYKMSQWEEPYRDEKYSIGGEEIPSEAKFPRQFDVRRIDCCVKFSQFSGNGPIVKNVAENKKIMEMHNDFNYIFKKLPEGEKSSLFFKADAAGERISIPKDLIYEIALIIGDDNVVAVNDYAYYLYRNKEPILAAMLLKVINQKYPKRVVAVLNLADAYWDIGMKKDACLLYKDYANKMNEQGKSSRIPASVKSKLDCP
jgi:hypothetical protein